MALTGVYWQPVLHLLERESALPLAEDQRTGRAAPPHQDQGRYAFQPVDGNEDRQ